MVIKGKWVGEEIEVGDGWKDSTLKTLIRCVAEDVERYKRHEIIKANKGYSRPVFPNSPLTYHDHARAA